MDMRLESKVEVEVPVWGRQHCSRRGRLCSNPQLVPSFISRGAARHTARETPASEGRKHY
jgi:hypothetical protein